MINDSELKLLISLLKEIDKHGTNTFITLCQKIADSGINDLENIARLLPFRSSTPKKTTKPNKTIDFSSLLNDELETVDYKKKEIFQEIISSFKSKKSIRNLKDLSKYLNSLGVSIKTIRSWDEGCFLFVKEIKGDSIESLDKIRQEVGISNYDDRSLEGWSDIILKNDKDET